MRLVTFGPHFSPPFFLLFLASLGGLLAPLESWILCPPTLGIQFSTESWRTWDDLDDHGTISKSNFLAKSGLGTIW